MYINVAHRIYYINNDLLHHPMKHRNHFYLSSNPLKATNSMASSSSVQNRGLQNRGAPKGSSVLLCFFLCYIFLSLGVSGQSFACGDGGNASSFGFCDKSLGADARVADLVKRLTLQEKITFLVNSAGSVSRLGIPKYEWWSEALHGVSYVGPGTKFSSVVPGATSFPQPILTAASFNNSLFETIGRVTILLVYTLIHC